MNPRNFALQELFDRLSLEFHGEAVERHPRMRFVPTALATRADPVLVQRVLANLVSNALRYTRDGGVVIGARRRGAYVWVEVIDTGVGIPPEMQQQIFDEFFQIGNPGRDRRRGLGLGLAIVKRLVTLMGHQLSMHSTPGKGPDSGSCCHTQHRPIRSLRSNRIRVWSRSPGARSCSWKTIWHSRGDDRAAEAVGARCCLVQERGGSGVCSRRWLCSGPGARRPPAGDGRRSRFHRRG